MRDKRDKGTRGRGATALPGHTGGGEREGGPPLGRAVLARRDVHLGVLVRACTREDLPKLEWFGAFSHHREIFAEAYTRHERDENVMLVAETNGFPIGQAWVDLIRHRQEQLGLIWAVRVLDCFQNLGIGTLLMEACERVLRQRGYQQAEVGVEKDNPGARRLYERLGYRVVRELREEYAYTTPEGAQARHVVDQWMLRKDLSVGESARR